jgi:hypothetical protein
MTLERKRNPKIKVFLKLGDDDDPSSNMFAAYIAHRNKQVDLSNIEAPNSKLFLKK